MNEKEHLIAHLIDDEHNTLLAMPLRLAFWDDDLNSLRKIGREIGASRRVISL